MTGVDVRAEQVRTLYRQTPPVLITNCVNAVIVSGLLWGSAHRPALLGWLALIAAMSSVRTLLFRRYLRGSQTAAVAGLWGRRFVLGSATSGMLWGSSAFLPADGSSPTSILLVTFVIGGMCAAAAGTLASHLPAFLVFVSPALAGLALRMALFGDSAHGVIAAMTAIYGVGLFAVARVNHRALTEAFALRFENAELLDRLSLTQSRLEETNRTLEQRVVERSDALRKQAEVLRDAQRMESIGRLAGGVAHDFNNLLTIILANLSDVIKQRSLDEYLATALHEMRDAATKGADLVRQLLMFSRRQRTLPETLDLNRTVAAMDRLLSRLLGEPLTLELVLEQTPLWVHVDPTQLEQVIINLVTNARDAMPNGGVVSIETRLLELSEPTDGLDSGRYALLSVSDTGSGIDSETRHNIFEPFFTTKEVGKGTGLGLATVYGIVEQSGGHIRVSSEVDRGSCFSVYLPPAPPPARSRSSMRPAALAPTPAIGRPVTVLLVEDEPAVRHVTQRILRSVGHEVLAAPSAERALSVSEEHSGPIELLVTDVVMAGIGGPALATRLRALRPELRTLFISGYSKDHAIPHDDSSGIVSFLAKPFTYDSLILKVNELLTEPVRERQPTASDE